MLKVVKDSPLPATGSAHRSSVLVEKLRALPTVPGLGPAKECLYPCPRQPPGTFAPSPVLSLVSCSLWRLPSLPLL